MRNAYGRFLEAALARRGITLSVTAAVLLSVVIPFQSGFRLDMSDASEVERNASIFYRTDEALDYRAMEKLVSRVEEVLTEHQERLGFSDIYSWYRDGFAWTAVYPADGDVREETIAQLTEGVEEVLPDVPGVEIRTGDWGMFRGRRGGRSAGSIRVRLLGDSPALLEGLVDELEPRLVGLPGATSLERGGEDGVSEIRLRPRGGRAESLRALVHRPGPETRGELRRQPAARGPHGVRGHAPAGDARRGGDRLGA